ncbi:MAG: transcription elongation factor GreAB [Verrucomicrobiota bacterium]
MSAKSDLLQRIRDTLQAQLERLSQAAKEAHDAATDPGSKAEGKYDTRSLEASYLASGQARQVDEAAEALRLFATLSLPDFELDDAIDAGALVELDIDDEPVHYLLVPAAGGLTIEDQGREITLLTPASELYRKLLGCRVGDPLDNPEAMVTEIS